MVSDRGKIGKLSVHNITHTRQGCARFHTNYLDPQDPAIKQSEKKRYLVPFPSNFCIDPTAVSFLIVPPDGRIDVVDCDIEKTGNDFEAAWQHRKKSGRPPEKRTEAMIWLEGFLAEGEKSFKDIEAVWEAEGFSEDTIRKAAKTLGVKKRSEGFGKDKVGFWSLPLMIAPPIDEGIILTNGSSPIDGENVEIAETLKI